ncbi:hypothetical protein CAPTEDRAFT_195991 [Capitella teleta]|uniref:Alkylglycerol monooxygenase n=1 Tax=Capitella teleta TaxID=283909 RepID=R7VB81_CAPTE|nr:hypothetical protein CAPTEDRAFT_195991 [Capitella teleta]|eukprot:ELU15879.1 hypothetical protein CAPTEDRAFT_195991 [Capitella teleta]
MADGVNAGLASALNESVVNPFERSDEVTQVARSFFYLITPNESSFEHLSEVPNYRLKTLPYAPSILLCEVILLWIEGKRLPRWNDSLTSLCSILLIYLPVIVLGQIEMNFYIWLYENVRLVDLPWNAWYTWVLGILTVDFGSYLWHRAAHEVNLIWAFHQVHHTPEDFNLFVGLRLPSLNRYIAIFFYLPCAFLIPPSIFATHYQLNYMFQFWIHTDAVPTLGIMDYIINNPSLHRVHHGRNRYCIDKNYGAVFSFWDWLFGTLQREKKDETLYYGLVHPINSWDSLYMQIHHLKYMFGRVFELTTWSDRISLFVKGPGWQPGTPRLGHYEDIPEIPKDKSRYDKKVPMIGNIYLLVHTIIGFYVFQKIKVTKLMFPVSSSNIVYGQALFILWTIGNIGWILEHKSYAPLLEAGRCATYFLLEMILYDVFAVSATGLLVLRITFALSFLFWIFNQNMFKTGKLKQK